MYARYRTRSRFYKQPQRALKAYGVSPAVLRQPRVKRGLLRGIYADTTVDLRDKDRLSLVEEIRHPKERDFYQDHTYHNQWIDRDLEPHQRSALSSRYKSFDPDFAVKPWIWFPGDLVEVVRGETRGERGRIIAVIPYKNEIIVEHLNVQDIVIPASESRPEQVIHREHPIAIDCVRHVDPSTNELCTVVMVKVNSQDVPGELEERRLSLESGVILPIPPREEAGGSSGVELGDPLKDTPLQDAEEETYDASSEIPLLVERKLKAMEEYFTGKVLKRSYEYHQPLREANAQSMRRFQCDVVKQAGEQLAVRLADRYFAPAAETDEKDSTTATTKKWWEEMIAPYVEEAREREVEALQEKQMSEREAEEERRATQRYTSEEAEDEEEYEEVEEVEERPQPH